MTTPTPAEVAAATSGLGGGTPPAGEPADNGQSGGTPPDPNAPTISQSHMNHLLAQQKRELQAKYPDYDTYKDKATKLDALTATTQTVEEQNANLTGLLATTERDRDDAKTQVMQQRLAGEAKLPFELWKFVTGSDEDSIKGTIEDLKKHMVQATPEPPKGHQRPAPVRQQGAPSSQGTGGSVASGRELFASRHKKS